MTPGHNAEGEKTSSRQRLYDKIVETPQMKAVRAKVQQKLSANNKPSPLSSDRGEASDPKTVGNKKKIFPRNFSSKLKDDKSVTRDKNGITLTPQMQVLYEKIEQRNSNISSLNKTSSREEAKKNKEQNINITNQKSTRTWEKREKNIEYRESISRNKHNIVQQNKNRNVQELYGQNVSSKYNYI